MADQTVQVMDHIEKLAEEVKLPLDKVFTVIRRQKKFEQESKDERRSSPEESEAIERGVAKLFADNPNLDMTTRGIAEHLGIRPKQGNLARISRTVRQLALTHQKAAE